MHIYVILLDLLHVTGVQRSGFRPTTKQTSLRFLRLSVSKYQEVSSRKTFISENLCHLNTTRFSTTVKTEIKQFYNENLCYLNTARFSEYRNSEIQLSTTVPKTKLTSTSFYKIYRLKLKFIQTSKRYQTSKHE